MRKRDNIYKYGSAVEWSLPVLFNAEHIWTAIYRQLKEHDITPPKVYTYGCPACNWAGGRLPNQQSVNIKALDKIFNYLHECNATPTFTFTYTGLTKEDLNDWYCNALLDFALEHNSNFIVYSDLLKDYIKNKSSNARITSSLIKASVRFQGENRIEEPTAENETNFYNKLLKEYDVVVVRPEYSKYVLSEHPEYIDDLSRIEVLINQICLRNCPLSHEHYKAFEKYRLGNQPNGAVFDCIMDNFTIDDYENENLILLHSYSKVSKLVKAGIKHLKLQGRGDAAPIEELLFLFYTQMFNTEGDSYRVILNLLSSLHREVNYFNQLVST